MSAWRPAAVCDAVAFSGLWVALAAAAVAAATAAAFGGTGSPQLLGLVAAGTFAVYAVDRLRDLARDRDTQPRRSVFVERHRLLLAPASGLAAVAAAACAFRLGAAALAVTAVAGGFGLAHRRLKHVPILKGLYVAASWTAVTVILPACVARPRPGAATLAWAVATIAPALLANAIAASARDGEAAAALFGARRVLGAARALAAAGTAVGLLAPAPLRGLAAIAAATGVALLRFAPGERYERVLDGALVAGALASLCLS